MLKFVGERGSFLPKRETLRKSFRISLPMGFEHMAICGAQIATTVVVAPLGIVAIAANSFAIIAESLCYMPGYGISEAATTLVGQSLGANRIRLLRRFANITVWSGMLIMGVMGSVDICGGSANHRSDDSRGGNPHVGNRDSADRSLCRADVCGIYRCLRCIR